jgi:hypothetical protein
MKALSFWKAVTMDKADLLGEVFAFLGDGGIRFMRHRGPSCQCLCGAPGQFGP